MKNSYALMRTKTEIRPQIMAALGIDINDDGSKVDWEAFMTLNQLLRYKTATDDQFLDFFVKFFDPFSSPVPDTEVERIIDLLFGAEKVSDNN